MPATHPCCSKSRGRSTRSTSFPTVLPDRSRCTTPSSSSAGPSDKTLSSPESRLSADPHVQHVETHRGNRAQQGADIPQRNRIEVVQDDAGRGRPEGGGKLSGQLEDRHVTAAHLDWGEARRQRLPSRNNYHLAYGDDDDGCREQPISRHETEHPKTD